MDIHAGWDGQVRVVVINVQQIILMFSTEQRVVQQREVEEVVKRCGALG